jgi:arginyl-tRNA synthetase
MSLLGHYRQAFVVALADAAAAPPIQIAGLVTDAEPEFGDFAFPTFSLAKTLRKAPPVIASDLAARVAVEGVDVHAVGAYVNARVRPMPFMDDVITAARDARERWGHGSEGAGKTVVIDYSSPNIAKPIAFHHIRSTAIGHAIANLYRAQGWRVEGINYLGDWGKQFGLVAVGFQEFGDVERREQVAHLVEVYVRANERAEKEPAFDEMARAFFRRMEDGDVDALALWREFRETSLKDFEKVYARLGIRFEHYEGESRYQGKMDAVIDEVSRTVGTKESDGALIVDLAFNEGEPPLLLKKSDGATLYPTRDLAAAIDRHDRFHFDRSLYVVAADQSLHFRQIFKVLEKMGKPWAKSLVHVAFGRVHGMSTRRGNLKLLGEVLDEAQQRALVRVLENVNAGRMKTDDPDGLAEAIGVGAIIFGDLKNRRTTDYSFDWDEVLSFEGHTGPYLQYAHARCCSILDRAGGAPSGFDAAALTLSEELAVGRAVARLPDILAAATNENEPSTVARWLIDLGVAFNRWYTLGNQDRQKRILVEEDPRLRDARVALTDAVRYALASGLTVLGLQTPERM